MAQLLRCPGYWKRTAPRQVGARSWLEYAWDEDEDWSMLTADAWLRLWWTEVGNAIVAFKNDEDMRSRLDDCITLKDGHDRTARKYYNQRQKDEERKQAEEGYGLMMSFGRSVAEAHWSSKKRKLLVGSDGQAVPDLVVDTPPSSSPLPTSASAGSGKAIPSASISVKEVGTVQRRIVKLLERSVDEFITGNCLKIVTRDPGKRVAEIRRTAARYFSNWVPERWIFHTVLDLHVEPGNIIRHRRPPWETDYIAISEVTKAFTAAKMFGSGRATETAAAHWMYVIACIRNSSPASLPATVTAVRCPNRRVQVLGDIPAAPSTTVTALVAPAVSLVEHELRAFLLRFPAIFPTVRASDDYSQLLKKITTVQLRESQRWPGTALHNLPVQRAFLIKEGQTVLGTARWARLGARAIMQWQAEVRMEETIMVLCGMYDIYKLLWDPVGVMRQQKDAAVIERGINMTLALFLGKVNVVDLRHLPDQGEDVEEEVEELDTDEDDGLPEEGRSGDTDITGGLGQGLKSSDGSSGTAADEVEGAQATPRKDAPELSSGGCAATEASGEKLEEASSEMPAEASEEKLKKASGQKLDEALRHLVALESAGRISEAELTRLMLMFAENEGYAAALCAVAAKESVQAAYVKVLLSRAP